MKRAKTNNDLILLKFKFFIRHVHNDYSEAVGGSEILVLRPTML